MSIRRKLALFRDDADAFAGRNRKLLGAGLVLWTALVLFFLLPNRGMAPAWTVPYYSGAANFEAGKGWRFCPDEVDSLKLAKGWDYYRYQFRKADESRLRTYRYNASGYLYMVYLSGFLFPFLNAPASATLFQLLLHAFLCYMLYRNLKSYASRFAFLILYACNPLIMNVVTTPFYYFFQVLPSFIVLLIYLNSHWKIWQLIPWLVAGGFMLMVRKTVFPMELFLSGLFLFRRQYSAAVLNLLLIFLLPVLLREAGFVRDRNSGPWHSVFVGLGAYPNPYPYLGKLSDNTAVDLYKAEVDSSFTTALDGRFVFEPSVQDQYLEFIKIRYLKIAGEEPLMLLRNALLNFFQGYSVGHISNTSFLLNLILSVSGLAVFAMLLRRKAYFFLLAIGFSHLAFTPYYPPIPVYMFGTYVLLVFAFCRLFTERKADLSG